MLEKQCFVSTDNLGLVHLIHPGYDEDLRFTKTGEISSVAAEHLRSFIRTLHSQEGQVWTLLSALGAGEYWGSNSNGDYFTESGLVHTPKDWNSLSPALQRVAGISWEWGYPTFYNAGVYRHHQNKDNARSFGKIHYVYWDPFMKRVLLIVLLDRAKAQAEGAIGVIDKIENGQFPPLSMGCRVPYDLCNVCTDWSRISGNPQRDLAEHRKSPIRGLSVTMADYCQHLRYERNRIYNDGLKAFMLNLHPKFFDISFVFVGADKTSYFLAKLAGKCPLRPEKSQCSGGCTDCAFGATQSLRL